MRVMGLDALPDLPHEVKTLVREGVYALYEIDQPTPAGGCFVLATRGQEFYVVSGTGAVVTAGGAKGIKDFEIADAVMFSPDPEAPAPEAR